jgi:hypothetical protein
MKKLVANCVFYVLMSGFLMSGSLLLISSVLSFQEAKESENWPTTTGVIVDTWVEKHVWRNNEGTKVYTEITYIPYLEYSYVVHDKTYSCQRVNFGSHEWVYESSDMAYKKLSRYPIGAEVDVYYDPAEPSKAVLVREISGGTFMIVMGVLFTAVPFVSWFIVTKAIKRSPPEVYTKTTFS